jgi:hypothetical protein
MVKSQNNKKLKSKNIIKANFNNKAGNNVTSVSNKSQGKDNKKKQLHEKTYANNSLNDDANALNNQYEQISNLYLNCFGNLFQNNEFACQIFSNYVTNLNLLSNDIWNSYANFSNGLIECKNIDDLNKVNQKGNELLLNIMKQMGFVNAQTYLDFCNEIVAPSLKQFAASTEKLINNPCSAS